MLSMRTQVPFIADGDSVGTTIEAFCILTKGGMRRGIIVGQCQLLDSSNYGMKGNVYWHIEATMVAANSETL